MPKVEPIFAKSLWLFDDSTVLLMYSETTAFLQGSAPADQEPQAEDMLGALVLELDMRGLLNPTGPVQ